MELDRVGETSATNLVTAIQPRDDPSAASCSARDRGVGEITGRNSPSTSASMDALVAANAEQITETNGIGPIVAELVHAQLPSRQCSN